MINSSSPSFQSPRILKADHELASTSASPQTRPSTKPNPNGSVVLVNEKMEFKDFVQQQLSAQAELGHVVGVVGPQGSGKSTLLSMMAANNPHDKFRWVLVGSFDQSMTVFDTK